jgi:hypothetical protein
MRKTCENSKIIDKNHPKYLAVSDIFLNTHTHLRRPVLYAATRAEYKKSFLIIYIFNL